jgi:hypothetical protein
LLAVTGRTQATGFECHRNRKNIATMEQDFAAKNINRAMCVILLLVLFPVAGTAQNVRLDNTCTFNEGIYTSFGELLNNAPRYPHCRLDIIMPAVGMPKYWYYDSLDARHTFYDSCFCVVFNRMLFVRDMDAFYKAYYTGAVTILQASTWHSAFQKDYLTNEDFISMLDFQTGELRPVIKKHVAAVLERDSTLFREFTAIKKKVTREVLLLYLIRYNARNPFYIKRQGEDPGPGK